jgi:outer membrane cobalamin receptor
MTVLSTGLRDGAHYLGRGTQGEPVETNLVCLATNPDTDGFGQAQSQLSIQKHDVTVSGLDCYHAKEHGNYDECAHGAVYNTVENSETDHDWRLADRGAKWKVNRLAL